MSAATEARPAIILNARRELSLALTGTFLVSNYLTFGKAGPARQRPGGAWPVRFVGAQSRRGRPRRRAIRSSRAGPVVPWLWVARTPARGLRADAAATMAVAVYLVRAAFWAILLIGLVDMVISFLRVEGLLADVFGADLAKQLGRSRFRGAVIHMPLAAVGLVIAAFARRSLGFHWLALLVMIAEMAIVLSRFVFSYEQAFQGDLVRFWYAGPFLFASAHTLFEDGHVRVDVLYAQFSDRTKGLVNAIGSLTWPTPVLADLVIGFLGTSSIISGPLVNYEISQSGFGMYVKYLMAGFLGAFAVTMMVQFISFFLESVADWLDEPGRREPPPAAAH